MQATDIMRKQVRRPCSQVPAGHPGLGILGSGRAVPQLGQDERPSADWVVISPRCGPSPHLEGALDFHFWGLAIPPIPHPSVPTCFLKYPELCAEASQVLSSQGPRVEILAKNLRVKDQMPQGAPR